MNIKNASISFRVARTTSIAHNNRENIHGNPDIDLSRIKDNVTYKKADIEDIYKREFTEAIDEYNSKQKRSDRKINNYYRKILNDKKTHHQRELIVAVGKKNDEISWDYKKAILDKYARDFQKENPNMIVYNSVLHMDEANPHLHINYVPVYTASRGLKKRVGHDKAIQQQGYDDFTHWQDKQRIKLASLMRNYNLEREHVGTHQYLPVAEYKELKEDVKDLAQKKETLTYEVDRKKRLLKKLPTLKTINVEVPTRSNRLNTSEIIIKKTDFEKIQKLARLAQIQSAKSDYYYDKFEKIKSKSNSLENENRDLVVKNYELENRVVTAERKAKRWKSKFKDLVVAVKDFVSKLEWVSADIYYSLQRKINELEYEQAERIRNRSNELELEL